MNPSKSPVNTLETIARSIPHASYFQAQYAAKNVKAVPVAFAGRTAIYSPSDAARIRARVMELLARREVHHAG